MEKDKKIVCITKSAAQTKNLGLLLAKTILESGPRDHALVLALRGNLGAGKTHFAQGFARGLGIGTTINSPTFVILKRYLLGGGKFKMFYHVDCYRLGSANDLEQIGIAAVLADPANIVAIEWPDIVNDKSSKNFLDIDFETIGTNQRRIIIGF